MKIKELRRWFSTTIATVAKKRKDSTFLAVSLLVLYLLALIFLVGVYKNSFGWGVIHISDQRKDEVRWYLRASWGGSCEGP